MRKKFLMMVALMVTAFAGLPALADAPAPLGAMESFDIGTVKTTVVPIVYMVIKIVFAVLGACFGLFVLRWGYNKVCWILGVGEDYQDAKDSGWFDDD